MPLFHILTSITTIMLILVINPGSTSTKIAVYEDEKPMLLRNIGHPTEMLQQFEEECSQLPEIEVVGTFSFAEDALVFAKNNLVEFALL